MNSAFTRHLGQVKWFNSTKGYGFITDITTGSDIFVYINDVNPNTGVKPCLYTGEYVEYSISNQVTEKYKVKAVEVTGVQGGSLLCDYGKIRFQKYSRKQFTTQPPQTETETETATTTATTPVSPSSSPSCGDIDVERSLTRGISFILK